MKNCSTCYWGSTGGKYIHDGDYVCTNDKSEHLTDYVSADHCCERWESDRYAETLKQAFTVREGGEPDVG